MAAHPLPYRRGAQELSAARQLAVDAWERADRATEVALRTCDELAAQREARRREHEALLCRCAELSAGPAEPAAVRAVLAHRDAVLRCDLAQELEEADVRVVGSFDDGADAAGTAVAEQPELVLVEDALPTMPGLAVLRRVRTLVPGAVTAAHVPDVTVAGCFVDGGVDVVLTSPESAAEMARQVLACLALGRGGASAA